MKAAVDLSGDQVSPGNESERQKRGLSKLVTLMLSR